MNRHILGERAHPLSAARDGQHRTRGTRRGYLGCWHQRGTEITRCHHLSSLPLPQRALCSIRLPAGPMLLRGSQGTWERCPGRDGAAKQEHLPQAHPACVRRQKLLRDAPLTCHQCSVFSSRSYCAPLSIFGSFARLILPGIHPLWT